MQPPQAPVALRDKAVGEIIEQGWMAGRLAPQSEVPRCFNQSATEVMRPNPVDQYPGRQRVVSRDDGSGQIESAAAASVNLRTTKHHGQPTFLDVTPAARIPTQEHRAIDRLGSICKYHRPRGATRSLCPMIDYFPLKCSPLVPF